MRNYGVAGCAAYVVAFVVIGLIGGKALEYSLETWVPFFTGETLDLPYNFWMFMGGAILSETAIPIAVVTLILSGVGVI